MLENATCEKYQIASLTILLEDPESLLRHLISLLPYDTSYPEYKPYFDEYGPEATIGDTLKAITPAFQDFLNISRGNRYDVQTSVTLFFPLALIDKVPNNIK